MPHSDLLPSLLFKINDTIDKNEEFIKLTRAVLMAPE